MSIKDINGVACNTQRYHRMMVIPEDVSVEGFIVEPKVGGIPGEYQIRQYYKNEFGTYLQDETDDGFCVIAGKDVVRDFKKKIKCYLGDAVFYITDAVAKELQELEG